MNILDTLTEKKLKKLKIRSFKKDDVLFYEDDICESVGIILEGSVSIQSYLNSGRLVIYNTINEHDMFGNNLIFSSDPYYKGDIVALSNGRLALLDKHSLLHLLKTNNDFLTVYLNVQSNFTKQLNNKIKLLSIESAQERFMFHLHNNKNRIRYTTISKLADELYLSRETLSRLLSKLSKQHIIKIENKTISKER